MAFSELGYRKPSWSGQQLHINLLPREYRKKPIWGLGNFSYATRDIVKGLFALTAIVGAGIFLGYEAISLRDDLNKSSSAQKYEQTPPPQDNSIDDIIAKKQAGAQAPLAAAAATAAPYDSLSPDAVRIGRDLYKDCAVSVQYGKVTATCALEKRVK